MSAWTELMLGTVLSGVIELPVVAGGEVRLVRVALAPGEPGAALVADAGLRDAAACVALERGDAWAGRALSADGEVLGGNAVLGLDLLRLGAAFPADLAVVGEFLADGTLVADPGAPLGALTAAGRVRLIVPAGQAAAARAAGADALVARHLSDALALATDTAWEEQPPPPPLPDDLRAEVAAELRKAQDRVGPRKSWELPAPLATELGARLRAVRAAGPGAWWASLDAEALPYAWALTLRALGPQEGQPAPEHIIERTQALAAVMDGRLERHLRGPADAVPPARALLGHGLVMGRALAAWEALGGPPEEDALGALITLAEAQARSELASLYVTDTMLRRVEGLVTHEEAQAAALLAGVAPPAGLEPLAERLRSALDGSAWTAVDAALGFGWLLAQAGPEGGEREAAERAVAEAVAAGLPMDLERLELAGSDDPQGLRELAVRTRVARLVLRAR